MPKYFKIYIILNFIILSLYSECTEKSTFENNSNRPDVYKSLQTQQTKDYSCFYNEDKDKYIEKQSKDFL